MHGRVVSIPSAVHAHFGPQPGQNPALQTSACHDARQSAILWPWLGRRMQSDQLRRPEFITLLCGAAAWPLAARAQQAAMSVIGLLSLPRSPDSDLDRAGIDRNLYRMMKKHGIARKE